MTEKKSSYPLSDLGRLLAADGIFLQYNALWKLAATGRLASKRKYGRVFVVGSWSAILEAVRLHGPKPRNLKPKAYPAAVITHAA